MTSCKAKGHNKPLLLLLFYLTQRTKVWYICVMTGATRWHKIYDSDSQKNIISRMNIKCQTTRTIHILIHIHQKSSWKFMKILPFSLKRSLVLLSPAPIEFIFLKNRTELSPSCFSCFSLHSYGQRKLEDPELPTEAILKQKFWSYL